MHEPGGYNTTYSLSELQRYLRGKGSKPSIEVELCFGEEFPDPKLPKNRKLIVAQVGAKEGGVDDLLQVRVWHSCSDTLRKGINQDGRTLIFEGDGEKRGLSQILDSRQIYLHLSLPSVRIWAAPGSRNIKKIKNNSSLASNSKIAGLDGGSPTRKSKFPAVIITSADRCRRMRTIDAPLF